MKHPVKH